MTEWLARKVGTSMICGRKVRNGYVCSGWIAMVLTIPDDPEYQARATLPPGMTEDPPGSGCWRATARARRRSKEGRSPLGGMGDRGRRDPKRMAPPFSESLALPFRVRCPVCNTVALVTSDVVSS